MFPVAPAIIWYQPRAAWRRRMTRHVAGFRGYGQEGGHTATDLPVPLSPMISTPPMAGSTTFNRSASFISSCPAKRTNGNAGVLRARVDTTTGSGAVGGAAIVAVAACRVSEGTARRCCVHSDGRAPKNFFAIRSFCAGIVASGRAHSGRWAVVWSDGACIAPDFPLIITFYLSVIVNVI